MYSWSERNKESLIRRGVNNERLEIQCRQIEIPHPQLFTIIESGLYMADVKYFSQAQLDATEARHTYP